MIPFDRQIWTAQECAEYLGISYHSFIKRHQHSLGFPKRLDIPGKPRWSAKQVTDWALGGVNEMRTSALEKNAEHLPAGR